MIDLTGPRATAEATLLDTLVVVRSGGDATLNRGTGQLDTQPDAEVWTGPCSVTLMGATLNTRFGDDRMLMAAVIRVPVAAVGIRPGDVAMVTAVHAGGGDPQLVGQPMTVSDVDARTSIVLRRMTATLVAEDVEGVTR